MVSELAQLVGVVLILVGCWLVWSSPWVLAVGGVVLLVVPEVGRMVGGRRR